MRQLENWIDSYLKFSENTEPPRMFHEWIAVSLIASALERKCRVDWGSITFYPNMYIVLVAPSGRARKGTAMTPALRMLQDLSVNLAAESVTREALVQTLNAAKEEIISHDEDMRGYHSSLTIFSPELTVFLGHQNFQLMSDLTDWYDCRDLWVYRTKGSGTDTIHGVWVNLIGATTPDLIQTALPQDAIGGGLTSRIIFVYEQNKGKIVPAPFFSLEEKALRAQLMYDLQQIRLLQGRIVAHEDFVTAWIDWYFEQERTVLPFSDDKRFAGYIERRANHVMKLSMIQTAARGDTLEMLPCDLERAIDLLRRTEVKMPLAFTGLGRLSHSDLITDVMRVIGRQKEIRMSALMSKFYQDLSKWDMENILESLEATKFIIRGTDGSSDPVIRYQGSDDISISKSLEQEEDNGKAS